MNRNLMGVQTARERHSSATEKSMSSQSCRISTTFDHDEDYGDGEGHDDPDHENCNGNYHNESLPAFCHWECQQEPLQRSQLLGEAPWIKRMVILWKIVNFWKLYWTYWSKLRWNLIAFHINCFIWWILKRFRRKNWDNFFNCKHLNHHTSWIKVADDRGKDGDDEVLQSLQEMEKFFNAVFQRSNQIWSRWKIQCIWRTCSNTWSRCREPRVPCMHIGPDLQQKKKTNAPHIEV